MVNGSELLMPIDPDFNLPRQHDKILVIQVEDRLVTNANVADTVNDPRLCNDSHLALDRTFALIEAIEMINEEPRSIKWQDFRFQANDGTMLDKAWLDLMMRRLVFLIYSKLLNLIEFTTRCLTFKSC